MRTRPARLSPAFFGATAVVVAAALAPPGAAAAETATVTPAEQLARVPNHLDRLPDGWVATRPIQLDVYFNLKAPARSDEAERFLDDYQRSIRALPDRVDLRVYRTIVPTRFQYAVSLGFANWAEYRAFESSDAFLKYYRERWKPAVAEVEERLNVVEPAVSR